MGFPWSCCPALSPRSKQPVKRYKSLVADVFSKSQDSEERDGKLVKLCEYASKCPFHIPKITRRLEERFYKELRDGHVNIVSIVMETYCKLLTKCGDYMGSFVASLLTLIDELLGPSKQVSLQIVGCQTLTKFIKSQADRSYASNIDRFVKRVCKLAYQKKEEHHQQRSLRASCLLCLSATVSYMDKYFVAPDIIGEVIHVMLDNYEDNTQPEEGRGGADGSACFTSARPRPERKNSSSLTREENEDPRICAQICLQRIAELSKESTTMRQVLEPMFAYFDTGDRWSPQHGLAAKVLCDMSYFAEAQGTQMLILKGVINHMNHKNVVCDSALKSCIAQVATSVARQIRFGPTLSDVRCIFDLLKHLRKSLEDTTRDEETNSNIQLQNSIVSCLLEIAKGINNPRSLFDVMVVSLEKVPRVGVIAQATMGSLLVLAHVSVAVYSHSKQVFPEALLVELLKAMLHSDTEARVLAHQIFSALIFPNCSRSYEANGLKSSTDSRFYSAASLLKKDAYIGRDGSCANGGVDVIKGKKPLEDESTQDHTSNNSSSICKLFSITDRIPNTNSFSEEPCIMELSEDQISQLLFGFWIQINLSDNLPSNFEAIAHSYCLTLISSDIMSSSHNLVRVFQLPLSLRKISLSSSCGKLPPASLRSMVVTSTAMLMFAASRMFQMHTLNELLRFEALSDVDPYLGINENLQVYVKPRADLTQYGSAVDNQVATSFLSELSIKNTESETAVLKLIVRHLCCAMKMEEEKILRRLSAPFSPDDTFMFAPKDLQDMYLNQMHGHLKEHSSDLDDDSSSISSVDEDDVTNALSSVNISGQKVPVSPSNSNIMSVGQLLETIDEIASEIVRKKSVPSSPSFRAMAGHCEELQSSTRTKLSNVSDHDNVAVGSSSPPLLQGQALIDYAWSRIKPVMDVSDAEDVFSARRFPPTNPFDNLIEFPEETLIKFKEVDRLLEIVRGIS